MPELFPILDSALQHLLASPEQFDFFQAVRLVKQAIASSKISDKGTLRFRTTPSLRFPANPIDQIKLNYSEDKNTWEFELQVSFLGLFGACGLLPNHYTELLIQRLQKKDSALFEFLDLFNHRIISLFYRAWQKNHFYVGYEHPGDGFTNMLHSLTGKPLKAAHNYIPDEVRLSYAGYFADQHRSAWSLQSILSDYFAIPIHIKQFQSKCLFLTTKDRMRLGTGFDKYNRPGINAVLGERIWDCQHHFRLALGPLTYYQFKQFLPGAAKLQALIAVTRDYIGNGMTFDICLMLQGEQVPDCKLSTNNEIALGRNAWLKTQPVTKHVVDTVLLANANFSS